MNSRQKAILYKIEAEWVLELICSQCALSKSFTTARAARDFARAKRIQLKRTVECDS